MAALVAAALAHVGDRPAWRAAILADRQRRPGVVIAMAALALLLAAAIAALAGAWLTPRLTPEAKRLFLALALALQGGGALWPVRAPARLDRWRSGAWATAFAGTLLLVWSDGMQLIVAALAARSDLPWLAAVGATLGALAVIVPAALLGERDWLALPLAAARRITGAAFLLVAAWLALGALGLI
ncbi:TMEM165/GDT1 family protein [Sphingomonas sp. A2-49]|uniref:TMEM165/GDT1 family protein n=1 Tax=Sphingomonas sp. A2-49 TaxID=1391375 RepID=UPI0021CF5343|nr:TMEM165/GDT1 family protein [Sphingomonas sp. A2-49]MCU6454871.1 TMEM165/GDT1 family protein [Sphingomonas sp. A2-49]